MTIRIAFSTAVWVLISVASAAAQGIHAAPRPAAQTGAPAGESATPDGYAPIPEWLGQTRAPRAARGIRSRRSPKG